jgi:excisionase family DNA binding protein
VRGGDLTLQDAADALGVHYMTVYRYVRLGLLPAERRGRSWVVRHQDLDSFVAERSEPVGPGTRRSVDWTARLQRRLLAGDRVGTKNVVDAALTAGSDPVDVYVDVVAGAMRGIGAAWEAGRCDVAHEHRASVIMTQVLGVLDSRFTRRGVRRGVVVAGCAPGERHALPLRIVADVVRLSGWEVEDLGADVPVDSLVRAASEADRLVAVAVSATTAGNELAAARSVEAVRGAVSAPVLLGGGAVPDEATARRLGADGWASDARGVVGLLQSLPVG